MMIKGTGCGCRFSNLYKWLFFQNVILTKTFETSSIKFWSWFFFKFIRHTRATTENLAFTARAISRPGLCESRQICRWHPQSVLFFYTKCMTRKCLTFKMKVKITEYNVYNGVIRWRISTSVKVTRRIFLIALTVFEMLTLRMWPWNLRLRRFCASSQLPRY